MTIMVTGASGLFGRAALTGLLERVPAERLSAMTRSPAKLADFVAQGVTVHPGDFDDRASLDAAMVGVETLLLISASLVGRRIPQHKNAIDAAVAAGVRRIVYTSFIGGGENETSLAVGDHRGTEALLKASGLEWTILRDAQYIDAVIEAQAPIALRNGRWLACAADGKMAQVTRQDCVASAVAVLTAPGHANKTYEITGPERLSYRQIAAIVSEIADKPVAYEVVDDAGMYAFFDGLGIPREPVDAHVVDGVPWCSDDMVSFERAIRLGEMDVLSGDVLALTGRAPQSLRSFAQARQADLRAAAEGR